MTTKNDVRANIYAEEERILEDTTEEILHRRQALGKAFEESLVTAKKSLSANRMIRNLDKVADALRSVNSTTSSDLRTEVNIFRQKLRLAIFKYSQEEIVEIHSMLWELTMFHDPAMLERLEERRRKNIEEKFGEDALKKLESNKEREQGSSLKNQEEEEEKQRKRTSCARKCTWATAVFFLLVALSFLLVEFWSSQTNPALSTNLFRNESLPLPVVYACLTTPLIPTFEDLPNNNYAGYPLWGLRSYTNIDNNETYTYPETKEFITESGFLGPKQFCQREMQYLSKEGIDLARKVMFDATWKCFSCLRINHKRPVVLKYRNALTRPAGAVTLEFSVTKDLSYCYNAYSSGNSLLRDNIRDLLTNHSANFQAKGIVKIVGSSSLDVNFAIQYGFEAYESTDDAQNLMKMSAEASVFCNLYLFSGYFFPVKPGTAARYEFNVSAGIDAWKPVGNKSNFLVVTPSVLYGRSLILNRSMILDEIRMSAKRPEVPMESPSIKIFTMDDENATQPSFHQFSAALRENHRDMLVYKKQVEDGVIQYTSTIKHGSQKLFRPANRFHRFNISLDFQSFETEVNRKMPTTTLAEFLTDVFEYIGLFTGVCAYSLLVAPVRIYLRRGGGSQEVGRR